MRSNTKIWKETRTLKFFLLEMLLTCTYQKKAKLLIYHEIGILVLLSRQYTGNILYVRKLILTGGYGFVDSDM